MPMPSFSKRPPWYQLLQVKLVLLSLLALLTAVGVTGWALLEHAERDTLSDREGLEIREARRDAAMVEGRVRSQIAALGVVGRDITAAMLAEPKQLEGLLRERPLLRSQFDNVFVAGLDGRVLVMHDERGFRPSSITVADRAYFRAAVAQAQAVVSEIIIGRINAEPLLVIVAPLIAQRRVIGVLGGSIRLRSHPMLAGLAGGGRPDARGKPGEGALVVLTDASGRIVAHPDARLLGLTLEAESRLTAPLEQWQAHGRVVQQAGLAVSGENDLAAVAALPTANWLLWRLQPRTQVLAPLGAARLHALKTAATVAAALALATLLVLWILLKPLRQLGQRAERLFDPALAADAGWPEGGGEVGQLAEVLRRVVGEQRSLEVGNARVLRQLQSVMAAAPMGILLTRDRRLELVSPQACRLLGRPEAELLGQPAQVIYASSEDYARIGPMVGQAFGKRELFVGEVRFLRAGKEPFWGQLSGRPVDWDDASAGTIWILNDVSEMVVQRGQLEWAATHDLLTGLANRKALQLKLDDIVAAGPQAAPAAPAALLMLDLDRFKPINDQHGHAAGDAALRAVAQICEGCIREGDLLARLGGDEFAVLLERCSLEVASRVAEDIRKAVADLRIAWRGETLSLGISIGVAGLDAGIDDVAAWLAAADAACYEAKAQGRDTVRHARHPPLHLLLPAEGAAA